MSEWFSAFVVPDIAAVHLGFGELIKTAQLIDAELKGSPMSAAAAATLAELRRAYVNFNDELKATAIYGAAQAEKDILLRLRDTAVRSDTGTSPHLDTLIVSSPLALGSLETGAVGVGLISELNRAINPRSPGYGPYWRAQEYGTGRGEVKSQLGRILFGYFAAAGGGDTTPPQAQYAGGGGPHPIFFSTASGTLSGPQGGLGGLGTIGHEITPRKFLKYGKDAAAVQWRARLSIVEQQAIDSLAAITAP